MNDIFESGTLKLLIEININIGYKGDQPPEQTQGAVDLLNVHPAIWTLKILRETMRTGLTWGTTCW